MSQQKADGGGSLPVSEVVKNGPAAAVGRLAVVHDLVQAAQALGPDAGQVGGNEAPGVGREVLPGQGQDDSIAGLRDPLDEFGPL